ncbi:hypothetical protein BEWA_007710 [Theileria equi strain WA]|uniref:Importin N-terminal domain-containing protein n=1 Tax=Theileria equi strain WA TaxID=1537102 RepID=L0B0I3_THEEQ|nr:hypothetical protein BEWA_007710 [Theileria equi strain WA]AFZ81362.1 hypothetical protein BEWA_007710 [Theileria equi strain WA]|eukprot:XP_004831028.1 hypothetical protein BEWA_007710 [Theileria equi strain WA]
MAEISFIRSIISLCRQSLSHDRLAIKSAEEQTFALLQPQGSDIELKITALFKIIIAPSSISFIGNNLSDDELMGLKYATTDVQLWVAIFLKNYIRSNFCVSKSFGGFSDTLQHLIESFLLVTTLNSEPLRIAKPIASQLENALLIVSDLEFPTGLEYALGFISYGHMSDINPGLVYPTLYSRLEDKLKSEQALSGSCKENNTFTHLNYANNLINYIQIYTEIRQMIFLYNNVLNTNNAADISHSYFDFFNKLLDCIKKMCELSKGIRLGDIASNDFLQAANSVFPLTTLNTHVANPYNKTYDINYYPADDLFFFDDRKLYYDAQLWQFGSNVPELGAPKHTLQVSLSHLVLTEISVNLEYFKDKIKALALLKKFMKRYKTRVYSNEISMEFKVILTLCDSHLLYIFKYSIAKLTEYLSILNSLNTAAKKSISAIIMDLFELITHVTKIFCYIHAFDLPESFEDNAQHYFSGMIMTINLNDQFLMEIDSNGVIVKMKIAIFKLFRYYAERYQEAFHPFAFTCIEDAVSVSRSITQDSDHDRLCCAALNFLSAASSTHWKSTEPSIRRNPFMNSAFLAEIIQTIILPNIGFREYDLYLLDDAPVEFLQRELDSSSCFSRRFAAISFLKKVVTNYNQFCHQILSEAAKNVAASNDYKLKELYLQLVICSNFKGEANRFNVNQYFVDYLKNDFIVESQKPQTQQKNILVILATMKYICTFRKSISEDELVLLIPSLVSFLGNGHEAIRSFASEAIARILPGLFNHRLGLKNSLFQGLECLLNMMRSNKSCNEFYIKCTMKIFLFLREDIRESGLLTLEIIIDLIKAVSDNPINPIYNHYLFESLSILLRIHLQSGNNVNLSLEKIEEVLIPTLALIIKQEMHSFIPYSFQILYLLLKFAKKSTVIYVQLFEHLVCLDNLKVSIGNAQGALKLLVCYFMQCDLFENEILVNMEKILNIFHFCLTHRRLSKYSLDFLNGIIRYLPLRYYNTFLKSIVTVLLTFVHNNKTGDIIPSVITTIGSLITYLHIQTASLSIMDVFDSIQIGIGLNFMLVVYLPNAKKSLSIDAKKVHAIAISKVMSTPQVQRDSEAFGNMLEFLSDLISGTGMVDNLKERDIFDREYMEDSDSGTIDFDVGYVNLQTVDDSNSKRLLDPDLNVEPLLKSILTPLSTAISAHVSNSGRCTHILTLLS